MVKFRPTTVCCGCLSLLVGVELICLLDLINCVQMIALASSREPLVYNGLMIGTTSQVVLAAWSLLGIPIVIGAGIGALYRVELHLRLYFMYKAINLVLGALFFVGFLFQGAVCASVVSKEMQRVGTAFVCGFMDTFVFFWMLILGLVHVYFMYIIWSASEEVARTTYPELLKYTDALRAIKAPEPPKGPFVAGNRPSQAFVYAAPAAQTPLIAQGMAPPAEEHPKKTFVTTQNYQYGAQYMGTFPTSSQTTGAYTGSVSMPRTGGVAWNQGQSYAAGTPQSFMPFPESSIGPARF